MVKFVLSSKPDAKACTVAAIVEIGDGAYRMSCKVVICHLRRGRQQGRSWEILTKAFKLQDITFFEGKLHALDTEACLHVFQEEDLQQRPHQRWSMPPAKQQFYDVKLHLVVLHGRLHMVGRGLGTTRWTTFTNNIGVFALVGEMTKPPVPVKDFDGHAIFVGDACCDAFVVEAAALGRMIRENQICFVDDEKNMMSLATTGRRPFRLLQSYDVRNGCLRAYGPSTAAVGTWRCVTAQRFPQSSAIGPPLRASLSKAELLLWNVANCLGAWDRPLYTTRHQDDGAGVAVTVEIEVPKTSRIMEGEEPLFEWSFTQQRGSAKKAKQAAAHEAVTFLRSRFRSILDDSPWSSVPHYHSHVDEEEEAVQEDDAEGGSLFGYTHWYGDINY
ncbi:unnamed protein product [Triticum turgidum subsp. durum]|uniref:KIB1-4 beta-propeller domain-containing protein n=1 Tax=Triticum turgidum subsp. durum TaxID=4567 RepID=A0A9R1BES4_TRITD|nr:unnamed protein product [Triticum turgidum subsp. durum]